MEFVHLVGTEDVQQAGHNMQSAAGGMSVAASNIGYHLEQHQRFLEDWLQRFEAALARKEEE